MGGGERSKRTRTSTSFINPFAEKNVCIYVEEMASHFTANQIGATEAEHVENTGTPKKKSIIRESVFQPLMLLYMLNKYISIG